jgi:RHS repeat-associated protein
VAPNGTPRHMGTDIRYFAVDGLGSIVVRSDGDGNVLDSAAYSPWGDGTSLFGYTGRESFDGGLLYYRARNYDPAIGRFLSEEPMGFDGGRNDYAYADGNPVLLRDPFGLCVWICSRKTVIGLGNHAYFWDDRRSTLPD